jgi:uncharacterized protein YegP (UPF0339 family)
MSVYQDTKGEWRWRLKAANGKIVADSGEGYTQRWTAERAAKAVIAAARAVSDITVGV